MQLVAPLDLSGRANLDFETYSEAGWQWCPDRLKWRPIAGAQRGGIFAVGAAVYARHPSTEVLSLAYDFHDGRGPQFWMPGCPPPLDLFEAIRAGKAHAAWNAEFELLIWEHVCVKKLGWPPLPLEQVRCTMAEARAFALPGKLAKSGEVLDTSAKKLGDGERLIKKFSNPRNPTKTDPRLRLLPVDDPVDGPKFAEYNLGDIAAEYEIGQQIPQLEGVDLEFWQNCLRCNLRGVAIDSESVNACIGIMEQAYPKYNLELATITGGVVTEASKVAQIREWLATQHGIALAKLDDDVIKETLKRDDLPAPARRVLEIRQLIGPAGVKKIYAMRRMLCEDSRIRGLYIFSGARTGRDTGADVQPTNLVKHGVKLSRCECGKAYGQHMPACPWCGADECFSRKSKWNWAATDDVLTVIKTGSLERVEQIYGDALLAISGCIRGLFTADPGKNLISSDFSSIEAVVTAVLAGEQWRIDLFNRGGDIYLESCAKITKTDPAVYAEHKAEHGEDHPDRQNIGKPAELGLGFGGWISAWRQFDDTDRYNDYEVKKIIKAWREASPMIPELWGGQVRGKPWAPTKAELYGLEGAAISAILNPGTCYSYSLITYGVKNDVLYARLPSGRKLAYHRPRLIPSDRWPGQQSITFEGWNSNPKMGKKGWITIKTFGGRLAQNAIQAIANDIMRYSINTLERHGYPHVMRTYDEITSEVDQDFGSLEEFENLMATMPPWAEGWPIRATGGWRGKRNRKA